MRSLIVATAAFSCFAGSAVAETCFDFDGLTPGTTATVGPLVSTPTGNVSLQPFQDAGGTWHSGGSVEVVASNHAQATPSQELWLRNISFVANPDPDSVEAKFAYADFGGNVNLGVNGVILNLADLSDIGPLTASGNYAATVGGVEVRVTRVNMFSFHFGDVSLIAPAGTVIDTFGVGGAELFIDHFCW